MYDVHVLKSCHENTKALNFTKLCAGFVPACCYRRTGLSVFVAKRARFT